MTDQERVAFDAIRACLTPDLLDESERAKLAAGAHPVTGHCFIATHAAFHLIGHIHGLDPHWCEVDGGGTHWWLCNKTTALYLDPTHEQAAQPFPYMSGTRCMLYTRKHSRTNQLLVKVAEYLG